MTSAIDAIIGEMKDYPWEKVDQKYNEIAEDLVKSGYSGQDIIFIAMKLMNAGIYVTTRDAAEYVKLNPWTDEERSRRYGEARK